MADDRGLPPELREGHPLLGLGYTPPVKQRDFLRLEDGASTPGDAPVAEEVPVAFVYNMHPHVVMMTTPTDLEDFAVGFTLTEDIVQAAAEIGRAEVIRHAQGIEIQLEIPPEAAAKLEARRRALVGRTGCGLCGVETIEDAVRELRPVGAGPSIRIEALWRAERELPAQQKLNRQTGSLHAAAWATLDGALDIVREDVGRHNALDKVIGALARAHRNPADGFFVLTSRASYELVQKAVIAGAPLLATVSRPTGLAIRLAEATGLTLVALLRGTSANVYANGGRLKE